MNAELDDADNNEPSLADVQCHDIEDMTVGNGMSWRNPLGLQVGVVMGQGVGHDLGHL